MEGGNHDRDFWREEKLKKIKTNDFPFVETDDENTILRAKGKYKITEIPKNPNNYKEDGSDRPEVIRQDKAEITQKQEQDRINAEINRPNLLKDLEKLPHHFKTKTEYEAMAFEELAEYHSKIQQKPHLIEQILEKEQFQDNDQKSQRRKELADLTYDKLISELIEV